MALAKITITCTECGREFDHRKQVRNTTEAEKYEAWAAENVTMCPECYRKQMQADKDANNAAAVSDALSINMPELCGTDKQIAWAMSIRSSKLANIINSAQIRDTDRAMLQSAVASNDALNASWWIDHRNDMTVNLYRALLALIGVNSADTYNAWVQANM